MPREDLLTTDKEKARAKAEIRRFLTRLAVFAALCGVLFGVVFGLAVVPGSTMVPRLCGGDLVLFSRFERGTAAGQVVLYRQDGTHRGAWRRYRHCDRHRRAHHQRQYGG